MHWHIGLAPGFLGEISRFVEKAVVAIAIPSGFNYILFHHTNEFNSVMKLMKRIGKRPLGKIKDFLKRRNYE